MKRCVLMLAFAFGLFSCKENKLSTVLFYNKALEDSLELYISQTGVIKNPYNAPTIMDIWINVTADYTGVQNDTIVAMSASFILSGPPGYSDDEGESFISYPCVTAGAGIIKERICIVKYIDNHTFPSLVNEQNLTVPRDKYDFFYTYNGPIYDVAITKTSRLYKLNGKDSVILLDTTIGGFGGN